jgi:hypothetical protein
MLSHFLFMWKKFKHIVQNLQAYPDLGPDTALRRQVNQSLRHRPALPQRQWSYHCARKSGVTIAVADFAYTHLSAYSGLDFGRVRLGDRLIEDLHFPLVCWFDWEQHLHDDFQQVFNISLADELDAIAAAVTVEEMLLLLNLQVKSAESP